MTTEFRRQTTTPTLAALTNVPDATAYAELISRPFIANLTPDERITLCRKEWFKADMRCCAAFLSDVRNADEHAAAHAYRAQIEYSLDLLYRYQELEAAVAYLGISLAEIPEIEVLETSECLIEHDAEIKAAITRARTACFGAITHKKLPNPPGDTSLIRAAYLDVFGVFTTSCSEWDIAMWTKMKNKVLGDTWEPAGRQWKKKALYQGKALQPIDARKAA